LVDKLLLERISLAGTARTLEASPVWLQGYISKLYAACPDDLCAGLPDQAAIQAHLEDKLDTYYLRNQSSKKTLLRLSVEIHGRILRHLTLD
jgi:hypothetical protein